MEPKKKKEYLSSGHAALKMSGEPLLLHICCGPCGSGCLPRLKDRRVVLYYSNSNIGTREEYERRLDSVRILAEVYGVELETDPYDHEAWLAHISRLENAADCPERGARCALCFAFSLERTARRAAELGMNFATTLTVSPHKRSDVIFAAGARYARFEAIDFKKKDGFLLSLRESARLGLYRQRFCGCEFSARASGEDIAV